MFKPHRSVQFVLHLRVGDVEGPVVYQEAFGLSESLRPWHDETSL